MAPISQIYASIRFNRAMAGLPTQLFGLRVATLFYHRKFAMTRQYWTVTKHVYINHVRYELCSKTTLRRQGLFRIRRAASRQKPRKIANQTRDPAHSQTRNAGSSLKNQYLSFWEKVCARVSELNRLVGIVQFIFHQNLGIFRTGRTSDGRRCAFEKEGLTFIVLLFLCLIKTGHTHTTWGAFFFS